MLVSVKGGKLENPEKILRASRGITNSPKYGTGRNPNRVTLVRGKRSQHCAIPAPVSLWKLCRHLIAVVGSLEFVLVIDGLRRS